MLAPLPPLLSGNCLSALEGMLSVPAEQAAEHTVPPKTPLMRLLESTETIICAVGSGQVHVMVSGEEALKRPPVTPIAGLPMNDETVAFAVNAPTFFPPLPFTVQLPAAIVRPLAPELGPIW